jgi:hypothetical protein
METLKEYLINVSEKKKYRTCAIADKLLNIFNYSIESDNFENDIRTMTLKNHVHNIIIITSTIILDNDVYKKEYIEIQYNKYLLKFSVNF